MTNIRRFSHIEYSKIKSSLEDLGYCILTLDQESKDSLENYFKKNFTFDSLKTSDLETIHNSIKPDQINDLRLNLLSKLNENDDFCIFFTNLFSNLLKFLLGDLICTQRRSGLSVQIPNDQTSVLPFHSDVLAGNSSDEIAFLIPLTHMFETNSIFFISKSSSEQILADNLLKKYSISQIENMYKSEKKFLQINPYEILIFKHNVFHGNQVNLEKMSRVSVNIRSKSLETPFSEKRLGSYFKPFNLSQNDRAMFNL